MSRFVRIRMAAAAAVVAAMSACSDSAVAPDETFHGTWQWVVSEGGIAGQQYDPASVGFTVLLEYDLNGTVRAFRDDELVATSTYRALPRLSITTYGREWEVTYDPALTGVWDFAALDEHVVSPMSGGVVRFDEPCCDRYTHIFTQR